MQVARPQSLRRLLLTHELAFLTLVVIMGGLASTWAYFWQQSSEESIRLNFLAYTAQEIRSLLFKQIQEVQLIKYFQFLQISVVELKLGKIYPILILMILEIAM